jgi:calcineurin-like phosphoesterase family protein
MRNPRLFASIDEHDETLIANWNAVVRPDDTIWHLGDFCYRCSEDYARSVFSRLRGRNRFLLKGNHDRISVRLPWDGIFDCLSSDDLGHSAVFRSGGSGPSGVRG